MNEAQEQQLLLMIGRIAKSVDEAAKAVADRPIAVFEHLKDIKVLLGFIADGVAPPVNEPDSDPPPNPTDLRLTVLQTAERLDDIAGRVDQIEADGVAPPVNEPDSDPPPSPTTLDRVARALRADITSLEGRVDRLEAAHDPDRN